MQEDFELKRQMLVQGMRKHGYLRTKEIEKAFLCVNRQAFFPKGFVEKAYEDAAFPIGFSQTISQPSTIAVMLEMLDVKKGMRVLEVGSGCGYVVALLSSLVGQRGMVFGIDMVAELLEQSRKNLVSQRIKNFDIMHANGRRGWKEKAPFDRILVSAACNTVPKPLLEQLRDNGRLVLPVGPAEFQELVLFEKKKGEVFERERQGYFVFVPLQEESSGMFSGVA